MHEHDTPVEVANGVYHILLGLPGEGLTVNVFALQDADGSWVIIDTGWRNTMYLSVIDDGLRALGTSLQDISQVIVTHGHPDHAGLAPAIQEATGCTVYLGKRDEPMVARSHSPSRMIEWRTFMTRHGMPDMGSDDFMTRAHAQFSQYSELDEPRMHIEDPPDTLEGVGLQAIWTPGHSPGHACFWMPSEKVLFSGDHVLPHITPNVQMSYSGDDEGNPLGDYMRSLDKVLAYPAELVLPAHGEPFPDLKRRVDEIVDHHDARTDEVLKTMQDGRRTAVQVAGGVSWKTGSFDDLPSMHQRMAVGETLAHLRYLAAEGRVVETHEDERVFFSLAG